MLSKSDFAAIRGIAVRLLVEESAQDLLEYALLTAFIGLAGIAGFNGISAAIGSWYDSSNTAVNDKWRPCNPGVTSC
jgi:Flp pilus assembly pilin Flp